MKFLSAILLLCCYTTISAQSEWSFYGSSMSNLDYYIRDVKKVNRPGKVYSLWVKAEQPAIKIKNKKGQWITKASYYTVSDWTIDCDSKEYSMSSLIKYSSKGVLISSEDLYGSWHKAVPESMAEGILNYSCIEEY